MRLDAAQHLGVNFLVAGDDVAAFKITLVAGEVADESTGLLHQQRAGRHVPRAQSNFPETIETPAGDVREVERG